MQYLLNQKSFLKELLLSKGIHFIKHLHSSYDFDNGLDLTKVLESYATMGFQATNMSAAIDEINRMVSASFFSISFL